MPGAIRIMFSISIIAILFPRILFSLKGPIPFDVTYSFYFLKELLIGFILGFLASVPFYIAQSSGSLVDFMRGAQSLQITDPTTSTQTGAIGMFYNYIMIAIFFFIGGPFLFLDALSKSYHLIPVDKFLNPNFFSTNISFWKLIIGMFNYILSISIQLGAPAIIGILMAEMFLGISNRLAPQVQIVFLGISLKSWLGLAMLALAWYYILQQLGKESIEWLKIIDNTLIRISK